MVDVTDDAPTRMADRQRVKRAELVRAEVVEAALAEFAERGYHQTSIAHIANRLGAGHSMFYRYFENKRDILEHVVRHVMQRVLSAIAETSPTQPNTLAEFHDFAVNLGMAYSDMLTEDPRLTRLMLLPSVAIDQEMTEKFCRGFDVATEAVVKILRHGIEVGYVRPDIDVDAVGATIAAIPYGMMLRHQHEPDRAVMVARVHATADLVCRGIAASEPGG